MSYMRSQRRIFPSNWEVVPFDEAFKDLTGGNVKVQTREYLAEGALQVIDQGQSPVAGYVNDTSLACRVPLPCILFGDHTRILKFIGSPFVLGADGVKVLCPCTGIDARFAFYYLQTIRLPADLGYSRHFKYLRESSVPRPPLSEQRRIADILDKADAIRRKRKEAIALTEELLRSVFLEMFGDPVTNPKGWPSSTFGDQLELLEYGPRFYNEKYSDDGVRIVRITDLDAIGQLDFSAMPRLAVDEKDRKRYVLRPGDVIFARSGATVGKTALSVPGDPEAIPGAYFIRLRFRSEVRPLFARQVLASERVQQIIASRSRQSAQQNFSGPGIRELPLPVPPLALQKRLEQIAGGQRILLQHNRRAEVDGEAMFASLVQRAFSGQLSTAERTC